MTPKQAQRAQTAKIMGLEVLPYEKPGSLMTSPSLIQQHVTKGLALIKLRSQRSGTEHEYRIRKMPGRCFWFVDVKKEDGEWGYIGELVFTEAYRRGTKCWKKYYEQSAVFSWFWGRIRSGDMPAHLEVWSA